MLASDEVSIFLFSQILYQCIEPCRSPYEYKYVSSEEELGVAALKTGLDVQDHERQYRDQDQGHEDGVHYFKDSVSHDVLCFVGVNIAIYSNMPPPLVVIVED